MRAQDVKINQADPESHIHYQATLNERSDRGQASATSPRVNLGLTTIRISDAEFDIDSQVLGSLRVIVCLCFGVSDQLVRERVRHGVSLGAILEETGAGSACGSCQLAITRVHAGERAASPACRSPCPPDAIVEAA